MKFAAILFDMDGVLIDSELIWQAHEAEFIRQFIPKFPLAMQQDLLGRSVRGIYDLLCERFPQETADIDFEDFMKDYIIFGTEQVYTHTSLLPGVRKYLDSLVGTIPLALVSSSPFAWINTTIARHGLESYFTCIVSGEEVRHAKPAPDIYLLAAERLKIAPDTAVVIEDSANGILAAKAANMAVYGIRNGFNDEQELSKADKIFNDFSLFDLNA